jgi:hypothetical protein
MHLYWRIIEELKFLGEIWTFNDPSLARSYERWLHKNADAIALIDMAPFYEQDALFDYKGIPHALN